MVSVKKRHFLSFRVTSASLRSISTWRTFSMCASRSVRKYYNFVEIFECKLPLNSKEDHVHSALERAWGIS